MVKFEYQPWKKFIIHEVVKYPIEFFVSQHSLGVQPGGIGRPITWVDGIIFNICMHACNSEWLAFKVIRNDG